MIHTLRTAAIALLAVPTLACAQRGLQTKAFETAYMDPSVKPCDDFFRYVNGTWLKTQTIPGDRTSWGAFAEIQVANEKILRQILDEAAADKSAAKGSIRGMVGAYYRSAMDSANREKAGYKPIEPHLKRIADIKSNDDLTPTLAYLRPFGVGGAVSVSVGPDRKNSTMNVLNMGAGNLGLPDRDYYFKEDPKSKEIREKYVAHVTNMFKLIGRSQQEAEQAAAKVMAFETRMAKSMLTRVELRNPDATYNKHDLASLRMLVPNFGWESYFKTVGYNETSVIIVSQPKYLQELNTMLKDEPVDNWKTYLTWVVVSGAAPTLSSAFVNESFAFNNKTLQGQAQQAPLWRRSLLATDRALGEALGQLYVEKAFPPAAKARMDEMIKNIRVAMKERIEGLEWMSDSTKQMALKKLSTFTVKIGYPDKWRDYSKLKISSPVYAENVIASAQFEFDYNRSQLGQPVDKSRWFMSPPTVNAYYSPVNNEIVFPAGILQPPFFNVNADDAINYGGIGVVIGHEISHGFDDSGSKYDAEGNLKNWWGAEDRKRFEERTGKLVAQYNSHTVLDTMHVNGKLTLGENIGDLGGVMVAYTAYRNSLKGKPEPAPIDGFTADQRFFLGFGQIWRAMYRPEALRQRVLTDPHSPSEWRVNGTLRNVAPFYKAFGCPPPADIISIW